MKFLRLTIYFAMTLTINLMADACLANIASDSFAVGCGCDCGSYNITAASSETKDFTEPLSATLPDSSVMETSNTVDLSPLAVTDIFSGDSIAGLEIHSFVGDSKVITVTSTGSGQVPALLDDAAGSFGLLMAGLISYVLLANAVKAYNFVVRALRLSYQGVVLLPSALRVLWAVVSDNGSHVVSQIGVTSDNFVSGRRSLTVGFTGMLRMLAGSVSAVLYFAFSILYSTLTKAQRVSIPVCAFLFTLVSVPASVAHRLFWENVSFRRRVVRYPGEWQGCVRLAVVCSGSVLLAMGREKPGFCRSFAMSSPVSFTGMVSAVRDLVLSGGQDNSYLAVYQSRQLPLCYLFRVWRNFCTI